MKLYGRERELEIVLGGIERALTGRVCAMLIEGEAGIGKSALLAACTEAAAARNVATLVGRCHSLDETRPFAAIADAFAVGPRSTDPVRERIAGLLADSAPGDAPAHQQRVVDDFVDLVEATASAGPVVLAVEDLHWADPGTLLALRAIHKRVQGVPVALLWTLRLVPRTRDVATLLHEVIEDGATSVRLDALTEEATVGLASEILHSKVGPELRTQIAGASGNPLFVTELLGALSSERAITTHNDVADVTTASLPPSLRLTILRRVSFLTDATLDLLRLASVLGTTFDPRDLATFSDRRLVELMPLLDEARRASVLEEAEDALRFRHDLIHDALYEEIPRPIRDGLHREVAERLSKAGAPAIEVAPHLVLGSREGDRGAAIWLHSAGVETAARAPAAGIELLTRALEVAVGDDSLRREIFADLVVPLGSVRRFEEAMTAARKAVEGSLPAGKELRVRAQILRFILDFVQSPEEAVVEAEVALRCQGSDRDRVFVLGTLAEARSYLGEDHHPALEEAKEIARSTGDLMAQALIILTGAWLARSDPNLAFADAERGLALARQAAAADPTPSNEQFFASLLGTYSWVAVFADRFQECEHALREAMPVFERGALNQGMLRSLAIKRFESGEWDEAIAEIEGLAAAIGWGSMGVTAGIYLAVLFHREVDVTPVIEMLRREEVDIPLTWIETIASARGDLENAVAVLEEEWRSSGRSSWPRDSVRVALAAGHLDLASAFVGAREENEVLASGRARALHLRGLAESSVDGLIQAVELYRTTPHRTSFAFACADAAELLARAGRTDESAPLFAEALAIFEQIGARLDIRSTTAAMRSAGIRPPSRARRTRATTGWEAVTDAEQAVVRLAAEGLSNPEIAGRLFLSRYTVETHLKHVYAKTGIVSRAQLAAEFARRTPA